MDENRAVYAALLEAQDKGTAAALATVIRVQGSVPRHEGSKMLVYADKTFVGTVGGGAMESLVIGEAVAALAGVMDVPAHLAISAPRCRRA